MKNIVVFLFVTLFCLFAYTAIPVPQGTEVAPLRPIETIVIKDASFRVDFDPGDMTLYGTGV